MILASDLPDDVRKKICNGMGPKGGLWFKVLWLLLQLLMVGKWFRVPSDNHDVRCLAGGTEEDREKVGRAFLNEMLDIADEFSGPRKTYARFFALRAYELTQELEDDTGSWHFRDKPLTLEEVVRISRAEG